MMDLQAKSGRIVVEQIVEQQTSSGLFLPETKADARVIKGRVVSVGSPIKDSKGNTYSSPCSVGDTVFFKRVGTDAWTRDDVKYYFPTFSDVLVYVRN